MALELGKVEKKRVYTKHPAAGLFPALTVEEREKLKEDIRKNGLLESIKAIESEIVDGWHRREILQELGKPLDGHIEQLPQGTDPWQYAWSRNFHRRHMDAGQRACAAVEYQTQKDAREAQAAQEQGTPAPAATQPKKRGRPKKGGNNSPNSPKGKTAEVLADMFGISDKYVKDAKKLYAKNRKTFEDVKQGRATLSKSVRSLSDGGGGGASLSFEVKKERVTIRQLCKQVPQFSPYFDSREHAYDNHIVTRITFSKPASKKAEK